MGGREKAFPSKCSQKQSKVHGRDLRVKAAGRARWPVTSAKPAMTWDAMAGDPELRGSS